MNTRLILMMKPKFFFAFGKKSQTILLCYFNFISCFPQGYFPPRLLILFFYYLFFTFCLLTNMIDSRYFGKFSAICPEWLLVPYINSIVNTCGVV
jgi:hypothetical protein